MKDSYAPSMRIYLTTGIHYYLRKMTPINNTFENRLNYENQYKAFFLVVQNITKVVLSSTESIHIALLKNSIPHTQP